MKYPKKLKIGDTIGIVAPSSPISEEGAAKCKAKIESLGFKVKLADNLTVNCGGFMADTGSARGKCLNTMFADPNVDAIFCIRGGSGGSSCMEYLDLDVIRNNPKIFVGYSDITSMHLAFTQQCDLVTFHGPMVSSNMILNFDYESQESLFHALNADKTYNFVNPKGYEIEVLKEGKAEGVLIGGNLAILSASIGTPYEVDTKGKILFIEEIAEEISRLDRFARHLLNSGKLGECAGIILGQFTDCLNEKQKDYLEIDCFKDILQNLDIPVMYNIQSGHGFPMMTLPLGAMCTIDTENRCITFAKPFR